MESQEYFSDSQTSITPSPILISVDEIVSSAQDSQKSLPEDDSQKSLPEDNSQTLSIPSPCLTTLDQLMRRLPPGQENRQRKEEETELIEESREEKSDKKLQPDFDFSCKNLDNLNNDNKISVLAIVIPQISKTDLQNQSEEVLLHLSKVFGEFCKEKLKCEANNFRLERRY